MDSEIKSNINATINILNTWIPMKIKYSNIPGINICIAHNGKSLFTKSFGFSDIEKQIMDSATGILVLTEVERQDIVNLYQINADKIQVISGGGDNATRLSEISIFQKCDDRF